MKLDKDPESMDAEGTEQADHRTQEEDAPGRGGTEFRRGGPSARPDDGTEKAILLK